MNTIFQIDYDLRQPGRNYESLITAIKGFGTWCHALKSTWLVASNSTASRVAETLSPHIDANDGLLVTRLQGEAAWNSLDPDVSEWIKDQLRRAA